MRNSLVAAAAFGLMSTTALAGSISIPMDQVGTVAFPRPVATVNVGNSAIADVNMIDSRHAFVLGKAFGITNILALDSQGRQVSNTYVMVSETRGTTVTLLRGSAPMTMSCGGPTCEVSPIPGDAGYKDRLDDVGKHHDLGTKSATTAAAP